MQTFLYEDKFYLTSDLSLVAALFTQGIRAASVNRGTGQRVTFYFRKEEGVGSVVEAFYSHSLLVDPMAYFAALKEAKTHLYGPPIPYGD